MKQGKRRQLHADYKPSLKFKTHAVLWRIQTSVNKGGGVGVVKILESEIFSGNFGGLCFFVEIRKGKP